MFFCGYIAIDATAIDSHSTLQNIDKPVVSSVKKQLSMTTEPIKKELPIAPPWGIKVNSKGKNFLAWI